MAEENKIPKGKLSAEDMYHASSQLLLEDGFCEGEWVTIYKRLAEYPVQDERVEHDLWYWCYIANPQISPELLDSYEPDLEWNQRSALDGSNHFIRYIKEGLEPLITVLRFDDGDIHKKQVRIHEDFIYMFHLYEKFDENGNRSFVEYDCGKEKVIITVTENEVKILHQYLYDFLAAKKMNLFCVIHSELNLPPSLTNLINCKYHMTGHQGVTHKEDDFSIINLSFAITGFQFQSWFKGKKFFPYKEFGEFKSSFEPDYAEFVIGYDRGTCADIKVRCDEQNRDYERSFFRRDVLEKYRTDDNVRVEPFYIDASPFFSLKCNNDHPDFIWAYLKNLRCLPYKEQLHWAAHNILPPSTLPEEYKLDHYADWASKGRLPEYIFKDIFTQTNKLWTNAFGWRLFKELTGAYQHAFDHLFSLGDDKEENFKILVKTMNLVLSESINVEKLKELPFSYPKNSKGIGKLTVVLESNGLKMNQFINYLLKINTIRSEFTDSHRNSSEMSGHLKESLDFFELSLDKKNFKEASINIFRKGIDAFKFLNEIIPNISLEPKQHN
mgnify:FL=1